MMRTSAAVSTSALTRTVRPPAIVISMLSDLGNEGLAGSGGGGKDSGTNAGADCDGADGTGFAPNTRRHLNNRLALRPWQRATSETDPPAASTSPTIARYCARVHLRRVLATISNDGEDLSPDIVPT